MPRTASMRVAVTLAALVLAADARAQATPATPGSAGAEAAVRAYTSAFATADWVAAARVIDPAELDAMVDLVSFIAEMDSTGEADALLGDETEGVAAFARFMGAVTEMAPGMREALTSMEFEILGTVAEGDSLAHVVGRSRTEMFGAEVQNVEVTSVRWLGGRWAVRLDEQMRGMTEAMGGMREAFEADDTLYEEDWDEDDG